MKRTCLYVLLIMNILALNGCGLAVKGVADTALGGTSELLVIEPVQDLQSYNSLEVIPFTSSVGGHLSTELLAYLNDKVAAYNSKRGLKQTEGRQLQLSGEVLHMTDGIYEKQILMQLKFLDPVAEQSLGLINVMGEANSIRGLTAVVDSLADSVTELLLENHFSIKINSF